MAREYISQVSKEIEGRVTKKLSKEFSRTKSRILDVLSKLDELILHSQVRTCSVAVPGISKNNNSENQEPTGDRSLGDRCPKAVFSACHYSNLKDSDQERLITSRFCKCSSVVRFKLQGLIFRLLTDVNFSFTGFSRRIWKYPLTELFNFFLFDWVFSHFFIWGYNSSYRHL